MSLAALSQHHSNAQTRSWQARQGQGSGMTEQSGIGPTMTVLLPMHGHPLPRRLLHPHLCFADLQTAFQKMMPVLRPLVSRTLKGHITLMTCCEVPCE